MVRDAKINEVKNMNLIYVFSTDSIFNNNTSKYIGIKVVYNDTNIIETDYSDPNFSSLIKRVIDRYNKEKDNRNIILLGDLTKKLINDASLKELGENQEKTNQIPYFSSENKIIERYKIYLPEVINLVMNQIFKYDTFKLENIKGYNHKYNLIYTFTGETKKSNMLLLPSENSLDFKIGLFEGTKSQIYGKIEEKFGKILVDFKYGDYTSNILFDVIDNTITRHISLNDDTYYHNDSVDTVLNEDYEIIDFYLNLSNIEKYENILKINDNTFMMANEIIKEDEEQVLFTDSNITININDDNVRITKIIKEGFSKYEGQINVELDKKIYEVVFRKMENNGKKYIIKETNNDDSYDYEVIMINDDINLSHPFEYVTKEKIEAMTIEDIKQYVRKRDV